MEDGLSAVGRHRSFCVVPGSYVFWRAGSTRDGCKHVGLVRTSYTVDELPEVPVCLTGIISRCGLAVKSPRLAYYFGATVDTRFKSAKKRYATAYVLEWAHAVAAALKLEHVMYSRVCVCEER